MVSKITNFQHLNTIHLKQSGLQVLGFSLMKDPKNDTEYWKFFSIANVVGSRLK